MFDIDLTFYGLLHLSETLNCNVPDLSEHAIIQCFTARILIVILKYEIVTNEIIEKNLKKNFPNSKINFLFPKNYKDDNLSIQKGIQHLKLIKRNT